MKRFLIALTALVLAFCCVGCGDTKEPDDPTPPAPKEYVYEGTPTAAPYTVYNEDGTTATEPFDNVFLAIRYAGSRATSSNAMPIKDANGLEVFRRAGTSDTWCFDGTNFVGKKKKTDAIKWAANRSRSYVVNGRGTGYAYLGSDDFTSIRHPEDVYELGSGGFSYLFTPSGEMNSNNTWKTHGYSYASAIVRLSEATYVDATYVDDTGATRNQWNAYIFFNIRGVDNCDLGIGTYAGGDGAWKITQNCSNIEHKNGVDPTPSFYVYQDQVVTKMTKDPETGIYSGADDLFIEAIGGIDTWTLKVTNLRTNQSFGYTHTHKGMNAACAFGNYRVITAASYCPVETPVWDPRAGGYIKNIVMEDVKVARFREDGDYSQEPKDEVWYGEDTIWVGFTQGADCAHLTFGTHEADGVYKSGNAYKKGGRYMSFSSYYDGTHIVD